MGKARENPFTPGAGEVPPHRAGHETAVRELTRRLRRLANKRPGGMVVLYGPRGTGKTTLLLELKARATRQDAWVRRLTPVDWKGSVDDFVRSLPVGIATKSKVKVNVKVKLGPLEADVDYRPGQDEYQLVEQVLHQLASKKPFVLLVDEAHRLPPDIGEVLLNAAQNCIGDGLPLLVALAGTPGVRANLRRAGASFWERSHRLKVGRLESVDAVRNALAIPAGRSRLPFTKDALDLLVAESQDYPFFIQMLGEQAWAAAIERDPDTDHIGLEDAQAGVRLADGHRRDLYKERRDEAKTRKILPEAEAVSKAFDAPDNGGVLSEAQLENVVRPALSEGRTVDDAIEELSALGLAWEPRDLVWEQGIPSLCTYLAKNAR